MTAPTIVKAAMESATSPLLQGFADERNEMRERAEERVDYHVRRLLERAYSEGLRDGFVQGTMAQAEAEKAA